MPTVHKILNEDGSYTILSDGRPIRSVADSLEADEVMLSLSYLAGDDDEPAGRVVVA